MRSEIIKSVEDLRVVAGDWDDLWHRSFETAPTMRAELIAQWVERFAEDETFHAILVWDEKQLVAALPLVNHKVARLFSTGSLPANEWSSFGALLLDTTRLGALDKLVYALRTLPWGVLWLDDVRIERPDWRAFRKGLKRAGQTTVYYQRSQVAEIPVDEDWNQIRQSWSKNHRKNLKRAKQRLSDHGEVRLLLESNLDPDNVAARLRRGFEVEDKNWKGTAGTSVLRSHGMLDFYTRQAEWLAKWGQLELAWLEVGDIPIAFEYGWNAKGVYHSFKVGYDQQFAKFSPGQLLMEALLHHFHGDSTTKLLDCMCPVNSSLARWRPKVSQTGRLVVATRGVLSKVLVYGYAQCWPRIRQFRNTLADAPNPQSL